MEKSKENSLELFHNTELLLKNYLNIKRYVKNSGYKTKSTFRKEFNIELDDYLESDASHKIDFSGTKSQREANKYDHYYSMLWYLEQAVKAMPSLDVNGELYRDIIVETYFNKKDSVADIVNSLSSSGIGSATTYYKYKNKAIALLSQMMWGFADRDLLMTKFN